MTTLGHEIGLHWDGRFLPADPNGAKSLVQSEATLLGAAIGTQLVSASQHFPTTGERLDLSDCFENDTYAKSFFDRYRYVSDSSMRWRNQSLLDLLESPGHYHLLLHPVWWVQQGPSADDKIQNLIDLQTGEMKAEYRDFLNFMNTCLVDRAKLDDRFRASLKAESLTSGTSMDGENEKSRL